MINYQSEVDPYYLKPVQMTAGWWCGWLESHLRRKILLYWKLKKLQWCDENILYFNPLWFARQGMVFSFFNIQYQSMGVGLLPSLDEIELRQSIGGLFYLLQVLLRIRLRNTQKWFWNFRYNYRCTLWAKWWYINEIRTSN